MDYSKYKVRTKEDLADLICDIMINDGPDGHVDGHDIITNEIWKRVEKWKDMK